MRNAFNIAHSKIFESIPLRKHPTRKKDFPRAKISVFNFDRSLREINNWWYLFGDSLHIEKLGLVLCSHSHYSYQSLFLFSMFQLIASIHGDLRPLQWFITGGVWTGNGSGVSSMPFFFPYHRKISGYHVREANGFDFRRKQLSSIFCYFWSLIGIIQATDIEIIVVRHGQSHFLFVDIKCCSRPTNYSTEILD